MIESMVADRVPSGDPCRPVRVQLGPSSGHEERRRCAGPGQRRKDLRCASVVRADVEGERDHVPAGRESIGNPAENDPMLQDRSRSRWRRLRRRVWGGQRGSCRGPRAGGLPVRLWGLRPAAPREDNHAKPRSQTRAGAHPRPRCPEAKYCSIALARPPAITSWPCRLAAIEPSNGSVMNSGSTSAPGMLLGVETYPG